jgi:copper(I)-binding protein
MNKMQLFILAIFFPTAVWAQTPAATITLDHVWARASSGKTGAIYLTINNAGPTDDQLLSAATAVADKVQLHTEINDNGVMKMRPVAAIDVKAHGQTILAPGGLHIMLIGLKHPLKEGDNFPLTLTFEKAGKLDVTVAVETAGSKGGMKAMEGMKM